MELTKEQELARFEELRKIGYQNLKGAEREEYSVLKEKYADELKDSEENQGENNQGDNVPDTKNTTPPAEPKKVDKAKNAVKVDRKKHGFVVKDNLDYSGTLYEKGQFIEESDFMFLNLYQEGYLIEV